MPYKNEDIAREKAKERKRKQRMSHPKEITMSHPEDVTPEAVKDVTPDYPVIPFDSLPEEKAARLEYIIGSLLANVSYSPGGKQVVAEIERALVFFKSLTPDMPNSNRMRRYENAYKYMVSRCN
jgi:hypothetical protein